MLDMYSYGASRLNDDEQWKKERITKGKIDETIVQTWANKTIINLPQQQTMQIPFAVYRMFLSLNMNEF